MSLFGHLVAMHQRPDSARGAQIHVLDKHEASVANDLLTSKKGVVKSKTMSANLELTEDTKLDMNQSLGQLAKWTIERPDRDPGSGLSTVLVAEVPCATHGCCSTSVAIRPNSTDLISLRNFFVWSEYKFLLDISIHPKIILDVGGVGMSAIWLSLLYPEAIIYRLEPNPSNFEIGVINALNMPNIRQFNVGLWNKNTLLQMCNMVTDDWGGDWPFKDEHGNDNSQQQAFFTKDKADGECESKAAESINVVLLSDFMHLMSIDRFDIIKMDIESAEQQVFSGDPGIKKIVQETKIFVAETHERFTPESAAPMRELFINDLGHRQFLDDENEIFLHPSLFPEECRPSRKPRAL